MADKTPLFIYATFSLSIDLLFDTLVDFITIVVNSIVMKKDRRISLLFYYFETRAVYPRQAWNLLCSPD